MHVSCDDDDVVGKLRAKEKYVYKLVTKSQAMHVVAAAAAVTVVAVVSVRRK